jgi:integrase
MKTIRKDWPQVRQYTKVGRPCPYYRVDLRRAGYSGKKTKNFTNKEAALKFAGDWAAKVNQNGLQSVSAVNEDPRLQLWERQLAPYGKSLDEAFQRAISFYQEEFDKKQSPFMSELLTLWVDDRERDKLKPLRDRSKKTIRHMANTFKQDFGDIRLKQVTTDQLKTYIEQKRETGASNQTCRNIRSYLGQFFNYCISKGHLLMNPVNPKAIEIHVQHDTPEYFTVEECQKIMETAQANNMVAYFSLCLFSGVRPEEAEKLTWKNIHMATNELEIPGSISKTKKPRRFVVSDNAYAWLKTLNRKEPLHPSNWRKAKRKVIRDAGDWIPDGLRHTFATLHYAKYKNLEELRHIMGNSPGIIEKFYRGVIPQAEIEKFWSILPAKPAKARK